MLEAGALGRGWGVVGLATLAAWVPDIIRIGIPPLLTALTGARLRLHAAGVSPRRHRFAAERAEVASVEHVLSPLPD